MRKLTLAAIAILSTSLATQASAQSFTFDVIWEPVESVGGLTGPNGTQYGGGSVKGAYVTTFEDGAVVKGTARCVGMGQPDGGVFTIHLTCTATDPQGSYSMAYGCNYVGTPGPDTPLGCVGGLEARSGANKGQRGALTMHWYTDEKATGTGQWYTNK